MTEKNNTKTTLREHQLAMLELLCELDRVCEKHNIKYSLFAGSLLGAVRHGGFIPWDDDADVIMERHQYTKFIEIAKNEIDSDKFFIQGEFSNHWPLFFSKLRLNNTACIERYHPKDLESHRGVYIDIFPLDNLSDNKLKRKLQFYFSKIVIAKSLSQRGYVTDSIPKKVFMAFCKFMPKKLFWKFVINDRQQNSQSVHSFFGASSKYQKNIYPRKWFTDIEKKDFEGHSFYCTGYSDELLSHLYGDYMTLPPQEERAVKVHAEIVDLNNSYEKYNDIHKKLEFDEYTRSIR